MSKVVEKQEVFNFLNELRLSGATNMFGATPYIQREYPCLSEREAKSYLMNWMTSFEG